MKIYLFLLLLAVSAVFLHSVLEETESLTNFLYGSAPGCDYDNWMSHLAEGIASPGYNQYAPWDRQTNGFGNYEVPTTGDLLIWGNIIDDFLLGNLQAAQDSIDFYTLPYQVVIFQDTDSDRTFHLLREIPNMDYYDDNGTADPGDDEFGAFDKSWGLYIHYPDGGYPHITTAPHPTDDFFTVPLAHRAFIDHGSKFLLINGCGREVVWTNIGNYGNDKSLSDPTRYEQHPFNVAYQKFCDQIRSDFDRHEFSLQVHGFDWGESHKGYPDVQISGGFYVSSPDLPIRDHSSLKLDLPNFCSEIVIPANYVGLHDAVHLNDYFGFHYSNYPFTYANDDTTFTINSKTDLWGYSTNRQIVYTHEGMSQYDVFERFFHVEVDELPNIYPQTLSNYHWFHGWNPVTQTWDMNNRFTKALKYYQPWIDALHQALIHVYEMNDNAPPQAPYALQVMAELSDRIKLQWIPGDCYDMDSYEILYSTEPIANGNYSIRDRSNYGRLACLAQDTFTLVDLQPGDQFYFAVRIRDKNGNYSDLSNEVVGTAGNVYIFDAAAFGRDERIHLIWKANCDVTFSGFNIYRKFQSEPYQLLASWQNVPALTGQTGSNISYAFTDEGTENGIIYSYRISYVDDGTEYFFGDELQAVSQKLNIITATINAVAMSDTCYFGYNEFASNGYDVNFDLPADTGTAGAYLNTEFYEQYWQGVPNRLEQEVYSAYDPSLTYKSWVYRVKTNQINLPVEITIVNPDRNSERFYLLRNDVFTNIGTGVHTFTPTTTNSYSFTLYWGNLRPSVNITNLTNQIYYPYETVEFSWSLNLHSLIDHLNVYAVNDEIVIPIASQLAPGVTSAVWTVPNLLLENLQCRLDLVMIEGDTLSYFSPFRFGIISPQNIVQTHQGWHLFTKNYQTYQYSVTQIYGEETEFYRFLEGEFWQIAEPEFLLPYWIYAPQGRNFELSNADLQRSACSFPLAAGWNLLPNPHRANYAVEQLVFSINNQDFEYYQAVANRLIEPVIFDYDDTFKIDDRLVPAAARYLYCHEDNLSVKFIPYYMNEYLPDIMTEWTVEIQAEQSGFSRSSLIVGTAALADSLYNPLYDLLKPHHTPFDLPLSLYLPLDVEGATQIMHRSMINPQLQPGVSSYSWLAEMKVSEMYPIVFSYEDLGLPPDLEVGLKLPDAVLNLSASGFAEYVPADTLISFKIIVSNQLTNSEALLLSADYSLTNFPNPFNPSTNIRFALPEDSRVELTIYNLKGQKVKKLIAEKMPAGVHTCVWNGKDENNKPAASGVYFYRLKVGSGKALIRKMLMLK